MSIRYLDLSGAVNFWTNIKNFILSKIPTKTSELTNDSGFLTQHQSLSNYVTLNSSQTITAIKTITGGNQGKMIFKNPNFTVGTTPESTTTVTRIYFGGGASYDGSTGVITNDISSNGYSQLEIGAINNNSSSSYRTSLILRYEQDQTRPRFIKSWGDFCPYSNDTYYLGRSDSVWKECYCNAYYLGTTAFGDIVTHNASEFLTSHQSLANYVTTNTDQDITGNKNFKGLITTIPNETLWPATTNTTADITSLGGSSIHIEYKSSGKLTDLSGGAWNVVELGEGCFFFRINNGTDIRFKHFPTNTVNRIPVVSGANRFINDVTPNEDNTYSLGTSSLRWKACYSNAYYLGTTAFGDIVTHNASEFLTSHQSLSSCVKNVVTNSQTIKSTAITRGTAPSSVQTFGIAFTDNNDKYIGNVYGAFGANMSTFVGLYAYKGSTTTNGDNASVRVGYDASGNAYTYAPTPATADNSTQIATTAFVKAQGYLTSHQSLANYVTTNTDQSISGIKSHSKHISILGDYIGNEFSTNARTCLYLKSNRDTDGKSGIYFSKYRQNRAQGALTGSDLVCLTLDVLENSVRTNNCISIDFRYFENDVPTKIYVVPKGSATSYMGTAGNPWTNAYITNLILNGNAFDPISTSGNIGDIVFAYADATGVDLSTKTTSGSYLRLLYIDRGESMISETSSGLTGTWKFLGLTPGYVSAPGVQIGGVWKRIA